MIHVPRGKIATIYNYKSSRSYADTFPEITQVRQWHIGGHKADVVDQVLRKLGARAKLIDRARQPVR